MLLKSLREFIKIESASGIILIAAALLALIFANSPLQPFYNQLFHAPVIFNFAASHFSINLLSIINDGLMTFFFLLVSLEIKRELLAGELNSRKQALLPGIAALGGMLCPVFFFFLFNYSHTDYYPGWAIPTATDIAFSLGILSLLGARIPLALKSFLMALAILDDLGAIIIIAVFYTTHINFIWLTGAVLLIFLLVLINYLEHRRFWLYGITGGLLWFCLLKSGVHTTIAGVITGFSIPLSLKKSYHYSPLKQLEQRIHSWVAYGILPLFALANAGLTLSDIHFTALFNPLVMGITTGLLIGKPAGVLCASWLAVQLNIADLPDRTSWRQLSGAACLCGIGFTMSLFIGMLAFTNANSAYIELIQLSVFIGSSLAGLAGYFILRNAHNALR